MDQDLRNAKKRERDFALIVNPTEQAVAKAMEVEDRREHIAQAMGTRLNAMQRTRKLRVAHDLMHATIRRKRKRSQAKQ
jgi:hypothetical protein